MIQQEAFEALASSSKGIAKLRELILELAVRGLLVQQDPNDEPASVLLEKIASEKQQLMKAGKIKKQLSLPAISEKDKPFDLPVGWGWVYLSDTLALITDGDHQPPPKAKTGIPFLVIGNLNKARVNLNDCRYVPEEYYQALDWGRQPLRDDILYTVTGSYGIAITVDTDEPFCVQRHVAIFKTTHSSPQKYLISLLGSKFAFEYATKIATGIAQKTVPLTGLRKMPIPLPPEQEQLRINAKIDELMALCDQLDQRQNHSNTVHQQLLQTLLESLTQAADHEAFQKTWSQIAAHFDTLFTTEASVDQLKQVILQLAVMGKLVPQDPNDEPVSELLKRIQAEKAKLIAEGKIKKDKPLPLITDEEKPFPTPHGWHWVKFDHIAENSKYALKAGPFGSALKKDMYSQSGYKIYGQEQVISGDENFGDYFIDHKKFQQLSSCAVKPGDILISLVGNIGRVLVLSENCKLCIINPRLVKISLFKEIDRSYFKVIFASPLLRNEMADRSHGGTMNILNLGLLRALALPLPPIEEQRRIVAKVDELMAICDLLKNRISKSQQTQGHLATAIVEKAVV